MTLILGGVTLNDEMIWTDRFRFQFVAQSVRRTLGGNIVTFAQGLVKGQPITLEAIETQGWLTKQQVEDVIDLANVVGGVYSLQIESDIFQVQFRHEDAPAVDMRAVTAPRLNIADDEDQFIGQIKVLTI